jgi:dihydrofolate synthase/folylpolyglutamate synthase
VAAAIQLFHELEPEASRKPGLEALIAHLSLPGRFNCYESEGVNFVLDVAHNPEAAKLLHSRLSKMDLPEGAKRIAVFGSMKDKDAEAVVGILKNDFTAWFLADLSSERAYTAQELSGYVSEMGCKMISVNKNVRQAFARVKSLCKSGDQVIAFGSFFVVSELMSKFENE